jgi:hypothetical protein
VKKAIIQSDSYRAKHKYLTIDYEQGHSLISIYLQIPGLFMPSPATSHLLCSCKVEYVYHHHTVAASSHTHCSSVHFLGELLGHQFTPHDRIQGKIWWTQHASCCQLLRFQFYMNHPVYLSLLHIHDLQSHTVTHTCFGLYSPLTVHYETKLV